MNTTELIQWLRDNSSGDYRPSAEAADLIEDLISKFTKLDKPKYSGAPMMDSVLGTPSAEFRAWVDSLPPTYWTRYDLSAARIGWEAGRRHSCEEKAPSDLFAGFDPEDHELMTMDGYDKCIVGIVERFGQPPIVCYSKPKVLNRPMEDGMAEDEAVEFLEFNQLGAWMGDTTPCFLSPNVQGDGGGFIDSVPWGAYADCKTCEGSGEVFPYRVLQPDESIKVGDKILLVGGSWLTVDTPGFLAKDCIEVRRPNVEVTPGEVDARSQQGG